MSNSNLLEQAALVLKSLPKKEAAQVMSKLEAADLRQVVRQTSELGDVQKENALTALNQLSLEAEPLRTSRDEKRRLLNEQLRIGGPAEDQVDPGPFRFMVHLPAEVRNELLANEHPENVALVMMHLPTDVASEMLRSMEAPFQVSTVRRLCEFQTDCKDQAERLAFNLKARLQKKHQRGESRTGIRLAAQLLSCTDGETRNTVLEYLNQLEPELVSELEPSIFQFEHLRKMDDLDLQVLLKNVDTSHWAPALKVASAQVREKVLSNLAAPVAELLGQQLSELSSVSNEVALEAQCQIVRVCVELQEQDKVDLPLGN